MAKDESTLERLARLEAQMERSQEEISSLWQNVEGGPDRYVTKESVKIAQTIVGVLTVIIVSLVGYLWHLQVVSLENQIEGARATPAELAREIVYEMWETGWNGSFGSQPFSQAEQHRLNPSTGDAEPEPVTPPRTGE